MLCGVILRFLNEIIRLINMEVTKPNIIIVIHPLHQVAVKFEKESSRCPQLRHEYKVYRELVNCHGFCCVSHPIQPILSISSPVSVLPPHITLQSDPLSYPTVDRHTSAPMEKFVFRLEICVLHSVMCVVRCVVWYGAVCAALCCSVV